MKEKSQEGNQIEPLRDEKHQSSNIGVKAAIPILVTMWLKSENLMERHETPFCNFYAMPLPKSFQAEKINFKLDS